MSRFAEVCKSKFISNIYGRFADETSLFEIKLLRSNFLHFTWMNTADINGKYSLHNDHKGPFNPHRWITFSETGKELS